MQEGEKNIDKLLIAFNSLSFPALSFKNKKILGIKPSLLVSS